MRIYILKRLLQIIPTILGITFVVFIMMRSIPGDPVVSLVAQPPRQIRGSVCKHSGRQAGAAAEVSKIRTHGTARDSRDGVT